MEEQANLCRPGESLRTGYHLNHLETVQAVVDLEAILPITTATSVVVVAVAVTEVATVREVAMLADTKQEEEEAEADRDTIIQLPATVNNQLKAMEVDTSNRADINMARSTRRTMLQSTSTS